MRPVYTVVLSVIGGFVIGYAGTVLLPWAAQGTNGQRDRSGLAEGAATLGAERKSYAEKVVSVLALSEKARDGTRDLELYTELQTLTAAEFKEMAPKMVEVLKRLAKKRSSAESVGEAWMERWLEVDAAGAFQFLSDSKIFEDLNPSGGWNKGFAVWDLPYRGAFKAVARKDPEWTRNFLLSIKEDKRRDYGVHLLAVAAAQKLGSGGKKLIVDFLEGGNRKTAIDGYATGLAQSSPQDAFQIALAESAGHFRELVMQHVLWETSTSGAAAVRGLLDGIEDPAERARIADWAIGSVVQRSGDNVRSWLEDEMNRAGKLGSDDVDLDGAIQEIVRVGDYANVADWALDLGADAQKNVLSELSNDWVSRDAAKVKTWLQEKSSRLDEETVKRLDRPLQNLVSRDPQAAATWAETLPAGALRDSVLLKAALGIADASSGKQVAAVYRAISAQDRDGALARRLAATLSRANGPEAGAWVLDLPMGAARSAAIRAVADGWGQRDPMAAAKWINELSPGPDRDGAVEEYADKITYADPAAGAEWVLEIEQEDSRQRAAEKVYRTWQYEDPGGAAAWVRQLPGVSEEWRRKTLSVRR